MAYQTKETLDNHKNSVTLEQYEKTMAQFKGKKMIIGYSFDRLYYAQILYAILRHGEKAVKGKSGKRMGQLADNLKEQMTQINFDEPVKLTHKNIKSLIMSMRFNP